MTQPTVPLYFQTLLKTWLVHFIVIYLKTPHSCSKALSAAVSTVSSGLPAVGSALQVVACEKSLLGAVPLIPSCSLWKWENAYCLLGLRVRSDISIRNFLVASHKERSSYGWNTLFSVRGRGPNSQMWDNSQAGAATTFHCSVWSYMSFQKVKPNNVCWFGFIWNWVLTFLFSLYLSCQHISWASFLHW